MGLEITYKYVLPRCYIVPKSDSKTKDHNQHSGHRRLAISDLSNPEGSRLSVNDLSSVLGSNLHVFTLAELRAVTCDFSRDNFLGEGRFGPVYKGFVSDELRPGLEPQPVAVKALDLEGNQGHKEWLAEVVILSQLKHPHLVKLIGYCREDEHRLLVYEYMPRGSLESKLFQKYSTSLSWMTRIEIALGAANGLAFLHGGEKPVIYRDFKSANILLDSDYTAKLSDFGFAKDGSEGDDMTRIVGTNGYAAPEYLKTCRLTTKSDVYSFGVVLLELITGRRAIDKRRPNKERHLVKWAKPYLKDPLKLERIMDPTLDFEYSVKGAKEAVKLARRCLSHDPKARPTMDHVVQALETILEMKTILIAPFVYIVPPQYLEKSNYTKKNS